MTGPPPPNPFAPLLRWLAYLLAPYVAEYLPKPPPARAAGIRTGEADHEGQGLRRQG